MDMNDDPVIVIVEDDPNIADLVELYLRRDGYRPYQASTGERALQVIAERNPELVLLDVGLPLRLEPLRAALGVRAPPGLGVLDPEAPLDVGDGEGDQRGDGRGFGNATRARSGERHPPKV